MLTTWRHIVVGQAIVGKQTHDAHLVAIMLVYRVSGILTFNGGHFQRYAGITVLAPEHV